MSEKVQALIALGPLILLGIGSVTYFTARDWLRKRKVKQTSFCYCPGCDEDLCSNGSFIRDSAYVEYCCTNCGTSSVWNFDAPTPILLHNS